MNVAIPVAQFHPGNTSEYVVRAFADLGHQAEIQTISQFSESFRNSSHDLYFIVDSGESLDLRLEPFSNADLKRVAYWFIDYRHHWDGRTRAPGDLEIATTLTKNGGTVFQSQFEDHEHCRAHGVERSFFLPLGADPEVWGCAPEEPKAYDISFIGNVWDRGRAAALESLIRSRDLRVGFFGHGSLWKEDGAELLRRSRIGFNISSYFGEPHAFDVNMRVFETLSCGVPLITNYVPGLNRIFGGDVPFVRTFRAVEEILPLTREALRDEAFLNSGAEGRRWIERNATYAARMKDALRALQL